VRIGLPAQQRQKRPPHPSPPTVLPTQNPLGQLALAAVQAHDAVFDRALRDEAIDRHGPQLADAVRTARGLVFGDGSHHGSAMIT
jgi:hypothetical protein